MARKNTKAEEAPPAEPALEQVESGGLGIDEGIVLGTFFLLLGSIVLVYFATSSYQIPQ